MEIVDFQDPKKSQSDFWDPQKNRRFFWETGNSFRISKLTGNSEGISQFTENLRFSRATNDYQIKKEENQAHSLNKAPVSRTGISHEFFLDSENCRIPHTLAYNDDNEYLKLSEN